MIILDTCTAINCFEISKVWATNLEKKCPSKKIIWEDNFDSELIGLSNSTKKYQDYIKRLEKAVNVENFNVEEDLSDEEYLIYITYLDEIRSKDGELLLDNLFSKNQKMSLEDLQTSGKRGLSNEDKILIALALTKSESILASDDNRILTLTEKYFTSQLFCCSAKIIEKANNINCHKILKAKFKAKNIYFYNSRYYKNKWTFC